jgi:hypothetical protein
LDMPKKSVLIEKEKFLSFRNKSSWNCKKKKKKPKNFVLVLVLFFKLQEL